jgi:hypothetical protein
MQFLEKAKKWGDMASVGVEFKDRLNRMERKFAVSMVIFKKFRPIFLDMFQKPDTSSGEGTKGNKPRKPKYDFILNLFLFVLISQVSENLKSNLSILSSGIRLAHLLSYLNLLGPFLSAPSQKFLISSMTWSTPTTSCWSAATSFTQTPFLLIEMTYSIPSSWVRSPYLKIEIY